MAAAAAGVVVGGNGSSSSSSSWMKFKGTRERNQNQKKKFRVSCSSSSSVMDHYKTLRIQPGASESEVRKAFRQLALKYHPDVCRGSNCGVQFHQINEAYDTVMANLREEPKESYYVDDNGIDEAMRGMNDSDYEMWEEWMGWEGAGIRDYSSHVNPYI